MDTMDTLTVEVVRVMVVVLSIKYARKVLGSVFVKQVLLVQLATSVQ